uniref:Putative adenylate cyclase n=1 Tax=Amblyomma aureolatum TaxID=187763 RepID=A0A1E1XCB9_9ACAR
MEGGLPHVAGNLVEDYLEHTWRRRVQRYRRRFREFFMPSGLRGTVRNLGALADDSSPEECEDQDDRSRCRKFVDFVVTLRLETFFFLYTLAYTMQYATTANLLELKACHQVLNETKEVCESLTQNSKEDVKVRNVATLYIVYQSLVGFLPGALITLVVASWCDESGRFRIPLCVSVFGSMLKISGELVTAVYEDASIYYNLICAIPEGLLGGLPAVLMSSYTITALSSSRKQRTMRFFTLQIAFVLALPVGQLICALTYVNSGRFVPLMGSSLGILALSWLCVVCLVRDTAPCPSEAPGTVQASGDSSSMPSSNTRPLKFVKHLFSTRHLVGSIRTVLGRHYDVDRFRIPLLVLSVFLLVLNSQTSFMGYFYAKKQFNWTFSKYMVITSAFSLASVLVLVPLLVMFLRWLPNQEYGLAVVGIMGVGAKNILHASSGAAGSPLFFIGYGFGMLSNIAPACIRSHVSRLLPDAEYGRLFSVMAACEALAPLLGRVMFERLFGFSKGFFAGLSFVVGLLFLLLPLGVVIYFWRKRQNEYAVMAEDPMSANENPRV